MNKLIWVRQQYFVRFIFRLPRLLLPIPPQVRNQVAGVLAITLWFFQLLILVVLSNSSWWGQLMVVAAAVRIIVGVVWMEGRRPIVHRTVRVR